MSLRPLAVPAIGLAVSTAPTAIAHLVPAATDLRLLGVCILGAIIAMSACLRR
jgi:hypothetical protein